MGKKESLSSLVKIKPESRPKGGGRVARAKATSAEMRWARAGLGWSLESEAYLASQRTRLGYQPLMCVYCICIALGQGRVGKEAADLTRPWHMAFDRRVRCMTQLYFCRTFV